MLFFFVWLIGFRVMNWFVCSIFVSENNWENCSHIIIMLLLKYIEQKQSKLKVIVFIVLHFNRIEILSFYFAGIIIIIAGRMSLWPDPKNTLSCKFYLEKSCYYCHFSRKHYNKHFLGKFHKLNIEKANKQRSQKNLPLYKENSLSRFAVNM